MIINTFTSWKTTLAFDRAGVDLTSPIAVLMYVFSTNDKSEAVEL